MNKNPLRIVVADDHPLVRAGVQATLDNYDDFRVVGEAHDTNQAYQLIEFLNPEMLILDLDIGGQPAPELVKSCRKVAPNLKILILSAHTEPRFLSQLRSLDISGFVLKDEAADNLVQAVRVIEQGSTWFSHAVSQQLLAMADEERIRSTSRLTAREQQVLDLMMQGKNNQAIAEELAVTKQTVRRYATVIYEKLGVSNRIQAILQSQGPDEAPKAWPGTPVLKA